jgi:CheY-like chemotaxis protein
VPRSGGGGGGGGGARGTGTGTATPAAGAGKKENKENKENCELPILRCLPSDNPKRAIRICVVEDDLMNRMILKGKLSQILTEQAREFVIDEADSGERILLTFRTRGKAPPTGAAVDWDIIVMDEHLQCGGMLGSECTAELRKMGCTAFIIACSANCSSADTQHYKDSGAQMVWPKPFPSNELMLYDLCHALS